jgi:predicted sugar kinase
LLTLSSPEIPKCKSKAGRKPWTPPDLGRVEALAFAGLTYTQIADALGIHLHTLLRKRSQSEEFAEALKRGKAKGISAVANKMWEMAIGGNVVACIFYLKCQAAWRESQQVDVTVADAEEQSERRAAQLRLLRAMTPEELQTIREINKRAKERLKEPASRGKELFRPGM